MYTLQLYIVQCVVHLVCTTCTHIECTLSFDFIFYELQILYGTKQGHNRKEYIM